MENLFDEHLSNEQIEVLNKLTSPYEIQAFLDQIPYSTEDLNRTPTQVIQDKVAHCLDGALFAAAALRRIGYPPVLVDMFPEPGMDDDHVLAIYKRNGGYGAVAKSNFPGLRMREPIHRSIRELVITYFEPFFNVDGIRTLRSYTRPLNLTQFDSLGWINNSAGVQSIEHRLLNAARIELITPSMIPDLSAIDPLSYKAGTVGVNPEGLYRPGKTMNNTPRNPA
jgi:hypothetical protein